MLAVFKGTAKLLTHAPGPAAQRGVFVVDVLLLLLPADVSTIADSFMYRTLVRV
jgi:hypothetical protein